MPFNNNLKLKFPKLPNVRANLSPQHRVYLYYSILIYVNHFAYGITTNIMGATLVDLRHIYSASLNTISWFPIAFGIGYLFGSQASLLYRHFNRQLLLIFCLFLVSLTITFLPHYGSLNVVLAILVVSGIGSGAWDSAVIIWLVDMWPGNSPVIQGANFMYGLGSTTAPILASPFVFGETARGSEVTNQERIDSLTLPFGIVGVVQMIAPAFMLLLYYQNRYEKTPYSALRTAEDADNTDDPSASPSKPTSSPFPPRTRISNRRGKIYLTGITLSCYATARIGYFTFCSALFQNLPIHLSAATSAHILGVLSSFYMLGRLATSLLSLKVQPDTIVNCHIVLLLGAILTVYFGREDVGWITSGTAALGYGFSAMWPGLFAFTERHLRLTDRVCSLYSLLSGSLSLVMPIIMGAFFNSNPLIFFYLEIFFIGTCLLLFICLRFWISRGNGALPNGSAKYSNVQ